MLRKNLLFTSPLNMQNPINHAKIILNVEDDQLYSKCSIFKYSISCSLTTVINSMILILEKAHPFKNVSESPIIDGVYFLN